MAWLIAKQTIGYLTKMDDPVIETEVLAAFIHD